MNEKKEYTFYFEATLDPRKHGSPYVARLYNNDGKIGREFYDLNKAYGKDKVTTYGKYTAKDGDIIETREGASWKNDYRYLHLVLNGELICLTDVSDSYKRALVHKYVLGYITLEELCKSFEIEEKTK